MILMQGKPVILEIDPPVDEISIRRKGFYTRLGYQTGYKDHELVVMSCPEPLSEQLYHEFNQYLQAVIEDMMVYFRLRRRN